MNERNCYNCKFKQNIAGDAHVSCEFPNLTANDKFSISGLLIANFKQGNQVLKSNFGFSVDSHPVQNGWFNFPINFDPNWIQGECKKHSENPDIKRAFEIENIFKSFFKSFDKLVFLNQKNKTELTENLRLKFLEVHQNLKNVSNAEDIDILIENSVKPLIKEVESLN